MKITLIVILISFFNISYSQKTISKELETKYTISPAGQTKRVDFTCLIPNNIEYCQKVIEINFSPNPNNLFTIKDNKYAQFTFMNITEEIDVVIKFTIELYNRDLKTRASQLYKVTESFETFLLDEKYIEVSDSAIINQALKLKNNDTLKTVKNIYSFIRNNLKCSGFSTTEIGAVRALELSCGDCTEFTDLFVALCRANGIPAKVIEGYATEFGNTPLHSWPEVYINNYGWIRCDPTGNNAVSFSRLHNKYVQLSSVRNDSILYNNHRWAYKYVGDKVSVKEEVKIIKN